VALLSLAGCGRHSLYPPFIDATVILEGLVKETHATIVSAESDGPDRYKNGVRVALSRYYLEVPTSVAGGFVGRFRNQVLSSLQGTGARISGEGVGQFEREGKESDIGEKSTDDLTRSGTLKPAEEVQVREFSYTADHEQLQSVIFVRSFYQASKDGKRELVLFVTQIDIPY